MGRRVTGFSEDAEKMLLNYKWPGNVRELANAVERALVVCHEGEIKASHLPIISRGGDPCPDLDDLSLQACEERQIRRVLDLSDYNITHAAKTLGIDRVTLYNKMRKYKIERA